MAFFKWINLSRGFRAKVDLEDYKELSKYAWHYIKHDNEKYGYAVDKFYNGIGVKNNV